MELHTALMLVEQVSCMFPRKFESQTYFEFPTA